MIRLLRRSRTTNDCKKKCRNNGNKHLHSCDTCVALIHGLLSPVCMLRLFFVFSLLYIDSYFNRGADADCMGGPVVAYDCMGET